MKWLNYHHLIYFREIARQGSLANASKILQVGQPALSTQLRQFEDSLGVKLFDRKGRSLVLTEAGKVALAYGDKISELGLEFLDTIHKKISTQRSNLRIGAIDAIPKHLVSQILDTTHKQTGCYLSVIEGNPDSLMRALLSYQLDAVISDQTLGSTEPLDRLYSKTLIRSEVHAYGSAEVLKKFLRPYRLKEILDQAPCILPTKMSKLRADLEHYFRLNGLILDRIAEIQDTMLQKILALQGDGIIFLPKLAASYLVTEHKLEDLGPLENIFTEYYLIYQDRLIENPAAETLIHQDYTQTFNESGYF